MAKKSKAARVVIDYRSLDVWIEGEDRALAGLAIRQSELEAAVGRHLSETPTAAVIAFKGKRRYLSGITLPGGEMDAVRALQFLYGIQAAIEAGDIDRIIRQSVGFAHADSEVRNHQHWKMGSVAALAAKARQRSVGKRMGPTTKKLNTPEEHVLLEACYANNYKKACLKKTADELLERHGIKVDAKTVGSRLKEIGKR